MTKDNEHKNIPELRFPEFKDDGEWEEKKLGEVADIITGNTPSTKEPVNYNGTKLFVSPADIGGNRYLEHTKTTLSDLGFAKTRPIKANSVLFVCIGSTIGKIAQNRFECATNQQINSLIPYEGYSSDFLYSLLEINSSKIASKAGNHAVPIINKTSFSTLKMIFPPSPEEQNKIANCLSSLDEVITANTEKLEILKGHKKGLMQTLFPQLGEQVPKYRFPEFKEDAEWTETRLGSIGEPLMCKRILKEQTTSYSKGGVPFYKIGTFGKDADSFIPFKLYEEFKSKYSFPKVGDILISASGTIGRLVVYDGLPAYFQDSNIIWLGNKEELILNSFLYHCYSTLKWQTSDGGIIRRLYNSDLKNMKLKYPRLKHEQQKIADTLSSLDDLITVQSEKIEQLKAHKKGIMQKLFPAINE
ncbi:type I restriction enzyme S subunit [Sphingobacterium zeae]|uniref:Type I restriction enzyme S subunit n=1 Tax=Sphingobacterium zeae TaxID=1776859 RepID=A0ABU0UAF9_9SPHI|nr:restriction endonuclease subunit S [Sphingobacterium zeae]MDQ1151857.1 type I restriction enzyme S subunit [Sphingobacterium zeae]